MPLSAAQQLPVNAITNTQPGHAILVLAGPGSGKTSTLVEAVIEAVLTGTPPAKIAAISFTNNSAAELKVRLLREAAARKLPALSHIHVSTFHAWVARLAEQVVQPRSYAPLTLGQVSLALALQLHHPNKATAVFNKADLGAAERDLEGCETFSEMRTRDFNHVFSQPQSDNAAAFADVEKATAALRPLLDNNQLNTFGTLMAKGVGLAAKQAEGTLQWLFIDEAQDLNRPQKDFVFTLQKSTGCRVFAIADDDQGIYKFRGASSEFLQELQKRATTQNFQLTENFRSTQPIVDLCREWISPNWTALNQPAKTLSSNRSGLPIVLLTASGKNGPEDRGRHAGIILEGAFSQKLIGTKGECALLGFSPATDNYELNASGLDSHNCGDQRLPEIHFRDFIALCNQWPLAPGAAPGTWHHPLWQQFLGTLPQNQSTDIPGLDDLYACVEVFHRLSPATLPKDAAILLERLCLDEGGPQFWFLGERPVPDYTSTTKINRLSLHSSKGMEFRAVWLNGNGYTMAVSPQDKEQGQPNFIGELFAWAVGQVKFVVPTGQALIDAKHNAVEMERRRLLYVGMSRATDLLIISVPFHQDAKTNYKASENAFYEALEIACNGIPLKEIATDQDARDFVATLVTQHRHPRWQPPTRYRVESFTSLTQAGQPASLPGPQSHSAVVGDHFHRIMHLLGQEPATLADRLAGHLTDADLVARVSTSPQPDVERLLGVFFADNKNNPWTWFSGARTEVPFETLLPNQSDCLITGFLDLATYDANGNLIRIVDWKTGLSTSSDAKAGGKHEQQLQFYARLLKPAGQKEEPELINYYVEDSTKNLRPNVAARTNTPPTGLPLPSSPQSNVVALRAVPAPAKTLATSQQTPYIPVSAPAPVPTQVTATQPAIAPASSPTSAQIVAEAVAVLASRNPDKSGRRSISLSTLAPILNKNLNTRLTPHQIKLACEDQQIPPYLEIEKAPCGIPFLTPGYDGKWLNIK